MNAALKRRIEILEKRSQSHDRKVHILKATDAPGIEVCLRALLAAGELGPSDGIICLTGVPPLS